MTDAVVGFRRVWALPGLLAIVTYGLVDRHRFAYPLQPDWSYLDQPVPRWLDRARQVLTYEDLVRRGV
ncbi:MAG TPA: hypothetical protein VJ625_03760, partial [Propionibacteriaceae bacterium]|nr:hypothetical protein [Propionibacteriaceae bacterium]